MGPALCQQGHYTQTQEIAVIAVVLVTFILNPAKTPMLRLGKQRFSRLAEQGTDLFGIGKTRPHRHGRQSCRAATALERQQKGFTLLVQVLRRDQRFPG